MPLYKVQHSCPLSTAQQDELAAAITELHTQKFTAPSLFVNVTFTDTSSQPTYVAGKRVCTFSPPPLQKASPPFIPQLTQSPRSLQTTKNSILAHVRHGPSRSQEAYNELCECIHEAWDRIVLTPLSDSETETRKPPLELNTVFIFGDIVAGREAGLAIPPAGEDERWVRENLGVLRRGNERLRELGGGGLRGQGIGVLSMCELNACFR